MARPKKNHIRLTDEELKYLKGLLKKKSTSDIICRRCRILIGLDENHEPALTYDICQASFNVSRGTIAATVSKYASSGLDGALKINRNNNSNNSNRKIDGRIEAELIKIACGPVPEGHSRWTLRLLEEQTKIMFEEPIGKDAIGRALKKTGFDLTEANTGAFRTSEIQSS